MKRFLVIPGAGFAALCVLVTVCIDWTYAQDDEYVAILKVQYAFENWVGDTKTNYTTLITNWIPDFTAMSITNFIATSAGTYTNGSKESMFIFQATNDASVTVAVRIYERSSVSNAHEAVMVEFGNCSAHPFPEGGESVDLGDRCYLGYPTNTRCAIRFVRNNVYLSVSADSTNQSVEAIAEGLDDQLRTISLNE